MTPHAAISRLVELGVSLQLEDLSNVERLHIVETATPAGFAEMIAKELPQTVTLTGTLLTEHDILIFLHFPLLDGIVAHRLNFANLFLAKIKSFPCLRSIAMSQTSLTDTDVSVLANVHLESDYRRRAGELLVTPLKQDAFDSRSLTNARH